MSAEGRLPSPEGRYAGGVAGAVLLAGAGVLSQQPELLLSAAIPVGYVAYGAATGVGLDAGDVTVERAVSPTTPFPGDRVRVRLTVENDADRPLPDLRVADGVPEELPVVDGTPRAAASLRPGESTTVEYTVVADRGVHDFAPVRVRARSLSGAGVATAEPAVDGPDAVACRPGLESVPVSPPRQVGHGRVETDAGGPGVEFHSTREYRSGDPVNRVDWRRFARGGDLTTVEFRREAAARVVVVVDARDPARVAPAEGVPSGAAMSAYAAGLARETLASAGHEVGVAVLGDTDDLRAAVREDPGTASEAFETTADAGRLAWVPPGRGDRHGLRVRSLLRAAADADAVLARRSGPGPDAGGDSGAGTAADARPDDPGGAAGPTGEGAAGAGGSGGESVPPVGADDPTAADGGRPSGDGETGADGDPDADRTDHDHDHDDRATDTETVTEPGTDGDPTDSETTDDDGTAGATGGGAGDATGAADAAGGDPNPASGTGDRTAGTGDPVETLAERVPTDAAVLFVTPALDTFPRRAVRRLAAERSVTVVSPDVTTDATGGGRLKRVERSLLLGDLSEMGVRVVDWERDRPLGVVVPEAIEEVVA